MAQHFEDHTVQKKRGDGEPIVLKILAEDDVKSFAKSKQVRLNINGVIENNRVLIYEGDPRDLRGNPKAASVVIEWAKKQGLKPIYSPEEEKKMHQTDRMDKLEQDNRDLREKLDQVLFFLSARNENLQEVSK